MDEEKITETVTTAVEEAVAIFKANAPKEPLSTRSGASTSPPTLEQFVQVATPLFISSLTSSLKLVIPSLCEKIKDTTASLSQSKIDQKLNVDRIETYNRQDNIILFGYEEPSNNYTQYGRESPEELKDVLITAGNKVGLTIDRNHISDGFRMGKRPVNSDGSPKMRPGGLKFFRPIFFRLNKRSTKTALLQKKKVLRESHGIKIAEDITPI